MTTITVEDIVAIDRQASLTTTVLADWAGHGTPKATNASLLPPDRPR